MAQQPCSFTPKLTQPQNLLFTAGSSDSSGGAARVVSSFHDHDDDEDFIYIVHCSFSGGEQEEDYNGYIDYLIGAQSLHAVLAKLEKALADAAQTGQPFKAGTQIYINHITEVVAPPQQGSLLMLRWIQGKITGEISAHAPLGADENIELYSYGHGEDANGPVKPFFVVQ